MSSLKIVANDTPQIRISLTDDDGVIDISDVGTTVRFKVKKGDADSTNPTTVVTCDKLAGRKNDDGTINTDPPYNVAGKGGRCVASCPGSLFTDEGDYSAEIEITTGGGVVSTVYKIVRIIVRSDF